MLAPTKKPYNPNYDQSTADDKNWNKTDLISFLDNIHNVPINDITPSGKNLSSYQTATKAEITAELIRTINFTHYKLLSGLKDLINYNNLLLNKIKKKNNSFESYEKKLNQLTLQTQRNSYFLLQLKMAHSWPDPSTDGLKNDTCQANEPRIDTNNDESIHPIIIDLFNTPTAILREPQLKQNTIELQIVSPTLSPTKDIISEVSSDHHNALDNIQSKCTPQASVILHNTNILAINDGSSEQNNPSIKIQKSTTANLSANKRGQIIITNKPQIELETTQSKPQIITSVNSCAVTRDTKKIIIKQTQLKSKKKKTKIKIKIKKKKKKINNKNNNKRNNKKKRKHLKNSKMNPTAKNIISDHGLEQIIREHFTEDDYQNWMNISLFDAQYTALIHYEKTYGASAIQEIIQSHKNDQ